ncbi:hypothetical protein AYL99_06786 [Fonsecaea erecta]|uniref:Uncharacterized protein n=1 Tax=Fonsecaea erecta TaxID=1367422 RepID=A0A178ZI74_9EURO|nr:hypothetical protein AYL99_06786 [Fonsecaea erecta]OAP59488.1 hypothetical protein AYL99_06786 [Fonsecaea erecta]
MSSTTATLPDDAFRSYVLDFLRHVPAAAIGTSDTARSELEALASEFYETSQDINMQELLLALHARYDLVGLGFFEKSALNEILGSVSNARGKGGTGCGSGCGKAGTTGPTTPPPTETARPQMPIAPDGVPGDLFGISSQFSTDVLTPTELDPRDLDPAEQERDGPGEDFDVCWKTEFIMTADGPVLVHKQSHHQRGTGK